MNPTMLVWRQVRTQTAAATGQGMAVTVTTLVLIVMALLGAGFGAIQDTDGLRKACHFGGLFLILLALMNWIIFMGAASGQNTPANAQLVPRLNGLVRRTAWGVWLLTALALIPFSYGSGQAPVEFVGMLTGITGLGITLAGREEGALGILVPAALHLLGSGIPALQEVLAGMPALVAALVLGSGYVVYGMRAAFPVAGEGHWKQLTMLERAFMVESTPYGKTSGKARSCNPIYAWLLRRACQRRAPDDLFLLGLGPFNTSLVIVIPVIALALIVLVVRLVLGDDFSALHSRHHIGTGVVAVLALFAGAISADRFGRAFRATSVEQAVLCLAPGIPPPARLTRKLGQRLLTTSLIEWLACSGALAFAVAVWSGPGEALTYVAMVSAAMLLTAGVPLADYARKQEMLGDSVFLTVTVWVAGLVIGSLFAETGSMVWWSLLLLVALTSLGFIAARWNHMMRSPTAFPTGRMA